MTCSAPTSRWCSAGCLSSPGAGPWRPPKRSPQEATPKNGRCWTTWRPWPARAWSWPRRSGARPGTGCWKRSVTTPPSAWPGGPGPELDQTRAAHRGYYLALVETADTHLRGPNEAAWLDRIEAEFDNIRAALAFSLADPASAEPGLRLASGLRWFCNLRGHGGEVLEALTVLLERPDAQRHTRTRARALTANCHLLNNFGDDSAVPSIAEEAIRIARGLADDAVTADVFSQLSWFTFQHGDLPAALARIDDAAGLARRAGDPRLIAEILSRRAVFKGEAGDLDAAHADQQETLTLSRAAAYARGRTLSQADAIALATETAGPDPEAASAVTVPAAGQATAGGPAGLLSEREREIVALLAGGATDAQIAARLFLSVNTVRSHLERIRDKTGARRRPDLVRYAAQAGIEAVAPSP